MRFPSIEILRIKSLRGPSMWTYKPVLEAWVDIGPLEDYPSNTLPGFVDRLVAWLPSLAEHRCSYGEPGGFIRRLEEGTWPAHILEHITLELQNLAGLPGGFGKARDGDRRGVYKVIVRAWHPEVTTKALYMARDLVMAAIHDEPFDIAGQLEALTDLAESRMLGPSTACIVDAAADRDIPAIRLADNNLVQFGYGARQRRIWTAETDQTSAIAEGISRDKSLTKRLLAGAGLPVPQGREVSTAEEAWEAAQDLGLPVVVKPTDGNHGRGVFIGLSSQEEVEAAFAVADDEGSGVLVEKAIQGLEHRLLVVGGRLVAAARGDHAVVVGDGRRTVQALIDEDINSDPRRGTLEEHPLNPIRIDSAARLELQRQGLTGDSIPEAGRTVLVQRAGNVSIDVTHEVHPEVAADAVLAAKVIGLDIAGIDLVAQDIRQPLPAQGAAIVEVNAGPGLLMHLKPAAGEPQPVGRAIIDMLFPPSSAQPLPVIGVSGSRGKTLTAQLISGLLQLTNQRVGLACSRGRLLNQRLMSREDSANWEGGHQILLNRQVDLAVIETSLRSIAEEGLPYERCSIGVVMGLDPQGSLPDCAIDTPEQIYAVLRTQVDVVLASGAAVLNAADPWSPQLAELCDGEVIYFCSAGLSPCSEDAAGPLVQHLEKGGRAVVAEKGELVLITGNAPSCRHTLLPLQELPLLQLRPDAIDSVLAATAAAWALNLSRELLITGLQTWGQAT